MTNISLQTYARQQRWRNRQVVARKCPRCGKPVGIKIIDEVPLPAALCQPHLAYMAEAIAKQRKRKASRAN